MSRLRRMRGLAVAAWIPLSWLIASGAAVAMPISGGASDIAPTTVVVHDAAEGWYAVPLLNLCATPLGCPPQLLPSLYPANTLHVGVLLGRETARAYLKPDPGAVPSGAHVLRATMTIPVATATTDGTLSPASATALACLATGAFQDGADGPPTTLPTINCHDSAKLVYDAKDSAFTVDLTPFFAAWSTGSPNDGIAVVADPTKLAVTDLWQLALNGRQLSGAPHISTSVSFLPPSATPAASGSPSPSPSPSASAPAAPVLSLPTGGVTAPVAAPPPVIAPNQTTTAPVAFSRGFKYPMAFLFPIALLAVGVFLTRLFTRDARPVRRK